MTAQPDAGNPEPLPLAPPSMPSDDPVLDTIEDWPGPVGGDRREIEFRRFANWLRSRPNYDPSCAFDDAEWFNRVNLSPKLDPTVVRLRLRETFDHIVAVDPTWNLNDGDLDKYEKTLRPQGPLSSNPTPPQIRFSPSDIPAVADEAERAMLADEYHERVFSHAGCYAAIRHAKPANMRERLMQDTPQRIVHYDMAALRERVMLAAQFRTMRAGGTSTPDKVHPDVIATLLSRHGGNAPPLTGLLAAPTVLPDGRVIEDPGYDDATGLFAAFKLDQFPTLRSYEYIFASPLPMTTDVAARQEAARIREKDSDRSIREEKQVLRAQRHARESYEWLAREFFGEFEFATPLDQSAAIAALITGLVRPTCGIAPGFLCSAPMQSSGKTTLILMIGAVVEGTPPGLNSWPEKDEELQKVLTSALLAGRQVLAFDNLREGIIVKSDKLARLLTSEVTDDRVLNESRMVRLNSNVLVLLSGNNVTLQGDMPSRIIDIYMMPAGERPDQRVFKRHDPVKWAGENRGDVVAAALNIVTAYLHVGRHFAIEAVPTRYPVWGRMVQQAIVWAGGEDVGQKFSAAYAVDPQREALRPVLTLWHSAMGAEPLLANEIIGKLSAFGSPDQQAFATALNELIGATPRMALDARKLGKGLLPFLNRPLDGRRLTRTVDPHNKSHRWGVAVDPLA